MKVLLADDNPFILEHFVKMINWSALGFDTILTAPDGKRALIEFEKVSPELVITDIQMPKMTGIELAERIASSQSQSVILFLTSYEEFSYVKSALELNVSGYLLKHETKAEQLIKVVKDAKLEIRKRRLNTKYSAQASFRSLIQALKDTPISSLEEYEFSLPHRYDFFMAEKNHIYPLIQKAAKISEASPSETSMARILEEAFPCFTALFLLSDYQFLLLFKSSTEGSSQAYNIRQLLSSEFDASFSILVLGTNLFIRDCAKAFRRNLDALHQIFFYPRSSILSADFLGKLRAQRLSLHLPSILELIRCQDFASLNNLLDRYYISCMESRDSIRFKELTRIFLDALIQYHQKATHILTGEVFLVFDIDSKNFWYDAPSICQWLKNKFAELAYILSGSSLSSYSSIVQKAIEYVNQHYQDSELGVDSIAEALKISSNRLNTVFKKETGETLWKLIIKVRMEKAKVLLNGTYKVSEICSMTGYKNISYFSKVFRESFGLTPLEYRRKKQDV